MTTMLTTSDISVLDSALSAFRATGDKRYTEEQYDNLAHRLAELWSTSYKCEKETERIDALHEQANEMNEEYDRMNQATRCWGVAQTSTWAK